MKIAKVIGNIWATRKEERLAGYKLLIVQPVNILDGSPDRAPIVAADMIGAGMGETVIIVGGSSARSAAGDMSVPVDATVVGIVDDQEFDPGILEEKEAVKPSRRPASSARAAPDSRRMSSWTPRRSA